MAGVVQPVEIDICRKRGDTEPVVITVKDASGTVIDVSGWSFRLAVDPEPDPTGSANNLFLLVGSFVTDGTDGQVTFDPSPAEMDQTPDTYFYDIERIDGAGKVRTIAEGKFIIEQDVTK